MRASRDDLQRTHGDFPVFWFQGDRFETQVRDGREGYLWDLQGYYGGPTSRLWFKSEGEGTFGEPIEQAEVQALYARAIAPFWDLQAGVRQDLGGPDTTHAVIGVQGLSPYMFEVDAALFLSHRAEWAAERAVLEALVAIVLVAFVILMLTNEFTTSALRRLAEMDSLTSVFNRRAFLTLLDKALSQARRTESELHVLVIDLDHFKRINDTWGHKCGDDVLRHFVGLAASCLRNEDVMGRLGGEEFAIVLPSANAAGAAAVAERLRALVASQPAMTEHGPITLTVSVGVTQCVMDESSETALQRADQAMYRAKELGRNQVHLQQAPTAAPAG